MRKRKYEATARTRGERLQKLRQTVFAVYGDSCWLCGYGEADTIDHIIPISNGGDDSIDNLRPAHGKKSKYCVGNDSRKRPILSPSPKSTAQPIDLDPDGVTYGDGWIRKKRSSSISTMFYRVAGMDITDSFVLDFINS